ncbi:hypothetical protein K9N68_14715 [Kovacikia minuta CCNUW1]|uniref:hypothetical protein n=1 Tax=Kovacikia minuta TaxID=2931930 RepID=UPI001CD02CAA|nr:hypothetical protein [Kovacikia minuta]UBF28976.1 hypothetical protein K9N68_14715 [Kovacikia minuta CCNUW1]
MLESADFQTLFSQLQSRYPSASLTSDLVQIHAGHYVVRAVVQVGGVVLATSLSAGATVELAEDQARLRVLKMLGIVPASSGQGIHPPENGTRSERSPYFLDAKNPSSGSLNSNSFESALPNSLPDLNSIFQPVTESSRSFETQGISETLASGTSLLTELEGLERKSDHEDELPLNSVPTFDATDPLTSNSLLSPEVAMLEAIELTDDPPAPPPPARSSKPRKNSTAQVSPTPDTPPPALNEPLDLTPLFLQIEDEMERIGWTKEQGRNHLKKAYNKRSRQQLTDEELMDFLAYLKTQFPVVDEKDNEVEVGQ